MELENEQIEALPKENGRKKYDMHSLLKNPNKIVSDQVKSACETLWNTIKTRVILKYNIASEEVAQVLEWVSLNLKFLGDMVEI